MRLPIQEKERKNISKVSSHNTVNRSSMRRKHFRGFGVLVTYLKPEEVMAGTEKVRTYKEWEELLSGDLGKQIGIVW
jgi:hypothetical protein